MEIDRITQWTDILLKLKDEAVKYSDPTQILERFSNLSHDQFASSTFGKTLFTKIFPDGLVPYQELTESIWGLQELIYLTDWTALKKLESTKIEQRKENIKKKVVGEISEGVSFSEASALSGSLTGNLSRGRVSYEEYMLQRAEQLSSVSSRASNPPRPRRVRTPTRTAERTWAALEEVPLEEGED